VTHVAATDNIDTLRAKINSNLCDKDLPAEDVIRGLLQATKGGLLGSAGGRFFAWVIGGSKSAGLCAPIADTKLEEETERAVSS
jgi:hypothetical protein